jgi:hypothetical protein
MALRSLALLVAAGLSIGACSGGGGDDDGASLGDTGPPTEVTAPDVPDSSPVGTGVVVVGGASSSFEVLECRLTPDTTDATAALIRVVGEGTTGAGVGFHVEVQRFSSATAVETFGDVVTYSDTARLLQVQRSEVEGEITDLRDPDARSPLVRIRPDGVSLSGIAGPPGSGGDDTEGFVGFALDATCP